MKKEGLDSAVGEEVPLLESRHFAKVEPAKPSRRFAQCDLESASSCVAFEIDENPVDEQPFCSPFLVLFFLGMFVSPCFHLCAMGGLRSNRTHEYFAGKLSAIACLVTLVTTVLWAAFILIIVFTDTDVNDGEDEY